MQFGLISGPNGFVGIIEALKQDDILKVLAEPTLATVSGRPASCLVGGKVAYPQPTGFGNISVAFQNFGTQIDFVPIVLGNGGCRLEVRPNVSEVDYTLGTTINGTTVPGFRVRQADTGVELKFGQTLAIAGLLSQETEHADQGHSLPDGRAVSRCPIPSHAQQGQRSRAVDSGPSGAGRRPRSRPGAAVRAGHDLAEPGRLRTCTGRATVKCRSAGPWSGRTQVDGAGMIRVRSPAGPEPSRLRTPVRRRRTIPTADGNARRSVRPGPGCSGQRSPTLERPVRDRAQRHGSGRRARRGPTPTTPPTARAENSARPDQIPIARRRDSSVPSVMT